MPTLAASLASNFVESQDIATMALRLRSNAVIGSEVRKELTPHRVHLVYELAYLKIFNQWEIFLEDVFLRYLCGYTFLGIAEGTLLPKCASIALAKARTYGTNSYLLWHSPSKVVARANNHFSPGNRIATVVGSALSDIERFGHVRHRIAHDHADARAKFDAASMHFAGKRFPGSRPGALLRTSTIHNGTNCTWLERISGELASLAAQLAP